MNKLLRLIYFLGKELNNRITIRELSIKSSVPYTTTLRIINKNKELFNIEEKGNLKLISLNLKDNLLKNYLAVAERKEADNFLENNKKIKIIEKELPKGDYSLILFGSRAEGKERSKSDVDLCIIHKKGDKNIKFSKYEKLFNLEINTIYLKDKEFEEMFKEKEHNLAKEIIKKHIILHGEEYFWNLVWKNV